MHSSKKLDGNYTSCFEQILKAAPYKTSSKPSKIGEQDILSTAGETRTNSLATFSYGLLHINTPVLAPQRKPYIHHLRRDTGYYQEDLSDTMADKDGWLERIKGIRVIGTLCWWWSPEIVWFLCLMAYQISGVI